MMLFDNYSGKRVVVTGACGFIGSHLVQKLVDLGAMVTALAGYNSASRIGNLEYLNEEQLKQVNLVHGDIRDGRFVEHLIKEQSAEIVFHLAALIAIPYSYQAPQSYIETNIIGTYNVLEAARKWGGVRVVHTSTSEVYGTAQYTPIDEKHPLQGQSPYSATKIGADKMAQSYFCSYGLPVVTVRPFNTYGPRQSMRAVLPTIMAQVAAGNSKVLLGNVDTVRDFNYVDDTVRGFLCAGLASNQCNGRVMNVTSGRGVTIGEAIDMIVAISGKKVEVVCDKQRMRPDKSEVYVLIGDNKLAYELLGWRPQVSLEEGLSESYKFMVQHLPKHGVGKYIV